MTVHGMLPQIRAHSYRVRDVALAVGAHLVAAGVELHLPLVEAGALLHDIAKTASLVNGGEHAHLGAQWLMALGYPAVAEIIREHVWLSRHPAAPGPLREVEIVNYADKRVRHDQIVSLPERFADLRRRYGRTPEMLARISRNEERSLVLEKKIFSHLQRTPTDLVVMIASGGGDAENSAGPLEWR
ncbi:MAG: HDIG domain-containing metalloprotein [Desulfobacca sp.]